MATRPLSHHETIEADRVFDGSLALDRVRIWERSWLAQTGRWRTPGRHMGVTVYNTIHFSRVIGTGTTDRQNDQTIRDMAWLIHELVHVWHYRRLGVTVAPKALHAQFLGGGYEYGGAANLAGKHLSDFNLEQQARIVEHYYIKKARGHENDLALYQPLVDDLRSR